MNTYARALILSAMTAVSLTQGCSCSDDDDPAPVVIDPPVTEEGETVAVTGTAAKGIVRGGLVTACPIITGTVDCSAPIAETTTDDAGLYSVTIPETSFGAPFVVRVTANENTRMMCDLAAGCGTTENPIDFGELYVPDVSNFELDAIVPSVAVDTTPTVNVTALTDLSSSFALSTVGADSTASDVIASISTANSRIADLFDIDEDITSLPVVDLTNPTAVASVDIEVLNYNLLGPSIVSASRFDNATRSIEQSLADFTSQFLSNGVVTNADASIAADTVDLAEIFAQANQIITRVNQAANTANVTIPTLSTLVNQITNNQNDAINTPPSTTGSQGTVSDTVGLTALDKVKKFVLTLGDVGASVEMASLGGDKTVLGESEEFEMQVEAAELATSAGLEDAVEATAMVVEAMARAYEAYDEDGALSSWTSSDGIVVVITPTTETNAETQEQTVTSVALMVAGDVTVNQSTVAIDMTATVDDVETTDDVSSAGVETETAMGNVMIGGTAESDSVSLTVKDTSHFSVGSLMAVMSEDESSETEDFTVTDVSLMLNVKAMQKVSESVADPVSFTGQLSTTLSMLDVNEVWTWSDNGGSESTTLDVEAVKFSLWGSVSNSSGDSMKVSLSAVGDGTGVTFSEMWSAGEETATDTETDQNYADLSVALNFDANLAGVIGAVKASFSTTRSAELAATSTFSLKWPGKKLTATATADDDDSTAQSVTVKNRDGVTAVFTEADGDWTGSISLKGVEYATVDGVVVNYSDDTFATLDIFE